MTAWIESLNSHSALWSAWLWRVCWQGAIVIAIAWLLTILLRRWSPRLRSWIWRLAYLKLLVLLVWTTPVTFAVLPAEQESGVRSQKSSLAAGPTARSAPVENDVLNGATSPFSRDPQGSGAQESNVAATIGSPSSDDKGGRGKAEGGVETATLSLPSLLLLAWSLGLILVVGWLAYETWLAIRLRRSARLVSSPELDALVREVQTQLGTRGNVRLAESESVGGPMLVKFATPVVVFPRGMLQAPSPQPSLATASPKGPIEGEEVPQLSADELRLVLAHELAHVKRHDLAWNALAAVVHAPLYFHPLLWLAHRLARQEQEMACDELVVTHLSVARHEYGQMLVKIVQQMSSCFRSSVAVVGMSNSFQTISRRLEAMKDIRSITRKQAALVGCVMALLAAVVVVPWRVVAQEAKPAQNAAGAPHPGPLPQGEGEKGRPQVETNKAEQLLVGTWLGSSLGGELTIHKDGTYQEFSRNQGIQPYQPSPYPSRQSDVMPGLAINERGTWKLDNNRLVLTSNPQLPTMRGLPTPPMDPLIERARSFKIVRLDDSFLRIQEEVQHVGFPAAAFAGAAPPAADFVVPEGLNVQYGGTQFYRRDRGQPAQQQFDPSIPADLKRIAELARLTPKEALGLVEVFNEANRFYEQEVRGKLQWKAIEKICQARAGIIDFAQLFQLTAAEEKAYKDLITMAGSANAAMNLAAEEQLAADELSAVNKLKSFRSEFNHILGALDRTTAKVRAAVENRVGPNAKFWIFLDELNAYLNATVFGGGDPNMPPGR